MLLISIQTMKHFLFFLSILIPVLYFTSCSKENNREEEIEVSEICDYTESHLRSIYKTAGTVHNNGLESFYNYLSTQYPRNTYEIHINTINEIIFDSIRHYTSGTINEPGYYLTDSFYFSDSAENMPFADLAFRAGKLTTSPELNAAALDIKNLIFNSWDDPELNKKFDLLVDQKLPLLSDCLERFIFVSMASVAKSSCYYWSHEGTRWVSLQNPNIVDFRGNPWKKAAYADARGAAIGAVRGAITGMIGGTVAIPGLGTAVGGAGGVMVGMITGAIANSAGSGLLSAGRWLIGWD